MKPKWFSGRINADNPDGDKDIRELSSKLIPLERIDSFIKAPVGTSCIAERARLNKTAPENKRVLKKIEVPEGSRGTIKIP